MAQLSLDRDILRWLQGLDLTFSVKDARRDFASGYLVAEIFSRYFPADFQLHSFDNGMSLAGRRDNWAQLVRIFAKKGIEPGGRPVARMEVEEIINCVPEATYDFITRMYEFLTGKRCVPPARFRCVNSQLNSAAKPAHTLLQQQHGALLSTSPVQPELPRAAQPHPGDRQSWLTASRTAVNRAHSAAAWLVAALLAANRVLYRQRNLPPSLSGVHQRRPAAIRCCGCKHDRV